MILRRLARLLLAAALLAAQQSALAHQIWHFAAAPAQHAADGAPQDTDAGGKPLCDLHAALGSVLGAVGSAIATPEFTPPQSQAVTAAALSPAHAAAVPPSSRSPPSLR
jgi:hypothetical protein